MALTGCVDDNAYDGENGLLTAETAGTTLALLQQINDDILIEQSETLMAAAYANRAAVEALTFEQNASTLRAAQSAATALFEQWKRVETAYVADKYDPDTMTDLPTQIDFFNVGKSDIVTKLDNAFVSTYPLEDLLYQSSTRSVTALEYTLYGHREGADVNMTQRRAEAALVMADYLIGKMQQIASFYANSSSFVETEEDSVGIMINQLIDHANKLKEARIGDACGYTVSYRDDPDAELFEYYKSLRSLEGMKAIVETQVQIMEHGIFEIASKNSAASEANGVMSVLDDLTAQLEAFDAPIENAPVTSQTRELYDTVAILHTSYTALSNALNFKVDIPEADGD